MSLALKIAAGTITQIGSTDLLNVNSIQRIGGTDNLLVAVGNALTLGIGADTTTIPGNLAVTGTMTVSSTATYEGNVNLGNGGDTVNIGSGTDTVNLLDDLTVGTNLVGIGSSTTDYLTQLWLAKVTGATSNAALNLRATGASVAGAYAVGQQGGFTNFTPTDNSVAGALAGIDAALATSNDTLQSAYNNGETIAVTATDGAVEISSAIAAVNALEVSTSGTGNALVATTTGSGSALQLKDGANTVFDAKGTGEVAVTPTSGQNFVVTTAGAGKIDLNSTDSVEIDAAATSTFTVTGANLNLTTATSGAINVTAAGILNMDAASATLDTTGAISIDAAAASNLSVTGANLTVSTLTSGTLALVSAGAFTVSGTAASSVSTSAGALTITGGAASTWSTSAGALTITGAAASTWSTSAGALSIASAAALNLDSAAAFDVNVTAGAGGDVVIQGTDILVDGTGVISLGASSTSDFTVTGAGLNITAGATLALASTAGPVTTTAGTFVTITSSASDDITFDARGMTTPITVNETGEEDLDAAFTATSIIGALNELKAGEGATVVTFTTHAGTATAGNVVRITAANTINDAIATAGDQNTVGILLNAVTPFRVVVAGEVTATTATAATKYYLSSTSGQLTSSAPTGSGTLVRRIGWSKTTGIFVVDIGEGTVLA